MAGSLGSLFCRGEFVMDFKGLVDMIGAAACVMSVKEMPDGSCGEIRIIEANAQYQEEMKGYVPGMIYSDLVPADVKFEDYCYRAAIKKQRMHAYVETKALNAWTDQVMIPLESDKEGMGYCMFMFEFTKTAEPERQTSVPINVLADVMKTCIKLRGTEDFLTTIKDVIHDIRVLCDADSCSIL